MSGLYIETKMSFIQYLLLGFVVLQELAKVSSIQNIGGSYDPLVYSTRYSESNKRNIIGFSNRNIAMPHSAHNFNPYLSSMAASQPVFSPLYYNRRNPYQPLVYNKPTYVNPSKVPNPIKTPVLFSDISNEGGPLHQSNIVLNKIPAQPHPSRVAFSFPGKSNDAATITFSNKPSQSPSVHSTTLPIIDKSVASFPNENTNGHRFMPIHFGNSESVPSTNGHVGAHDAPITFTNIDPSSRSPHHTVDPTNIPRAVFQGASIGTASTQEDVTDINNGGISAFQNETCLIEDGKVLFNGACVKLLARASCPVDHHLLLSNNNTPYCARRVCPWNELFYMGKCVDPADVGICNYGQILYVHFDGHVECDCEPDYYYDNISGNCYAEHEQSFCDFGYYIEVDDSDLKCVQNPCMHDYLLYLNDHCYKKTYRGLCDSSTSNVMVYPETNTADCSYSAIRSIFEVPTLRSCPRGSRRDFSNKCRSAFRVPSQTTLYTLRGECPTGFIRDPRGTCRKVVSLFG